MMRVATLLLALAACSGAGAPAPFDCDPGAPDAPPAADAAPLDAAGLCVSQPSDAAVPCADCCAVTCGVDGCSCVSNFDIPCEP